jgi:hypothetical protein
VGKSLLILAPIALSAALENVAIGAVMLPRAPSASFEAYCRSGSYLTIRSLLVKKSRLLIEQLSGE